MTAFVALAFNGKYHHV
ncbi:oxygen-independent coproporphyrinogen III oxidase domain protein, partial [Vibrio parahaemolyticus VP-48]